MFDYTPEIFPYTNDQDDARSQMYYEQNMEIQDLHDEIDRTIENDERSDE